MPIFDKDIVQTRLNLTKADAKRRNGLRLNLCERFFGSIAYATRPDSDRNPRGFLQPQIN